MKKWGFLSFLLALLIVGSWAELKEKASQLNKKAQQKMDEFYIKLKNDYLPGPQSVTSNLDDTYRRLRDEYDASPATKPGGEAQVITKGLNQGDSAASAGSKAATNLVEKFGGEYTSVRLPAGGKLKADGARGTVDMSKIKLMHQVQTHQSDLEVELNKETKSGLSYRPEQQSVIWSFSTGF